MCHCQSLFEIRCHAACDYTRTHNYAQPVWIVAATAKSPQVKTLFRQSLVEYCSVDRHSKYMDNHAYPPKVS
jgi:hypothetical protein